MHRPFFAAVFAAAIASPLRAQDGPPGGAACSYDVCALRVEEDRILKGSHGTEVGRLGAWSATPLVPLVVRSDSAQFYALQFDRHYAAGVRWSALSGLALGVAAVFLLDRDHHADEHWNGNDWAWASGLAFSLATGAYGGHRLRLARRGIARAIWWHNRELTR
jgi:hypothetical protein